MGFFTPLSISVALHDDQRRYRQASWGLFVAGLACVVFGAGGAVAVPEREVMTALARFWHYRWLAVLEGFLWLFASLYPALTHRNFRCIEWTLAVTVAFGVITHFGFVLVLWTGGLNGSVFAATFLSLLAISLLIPEDAAIKTIFTVIVSVAAMILASVDPLLWRHNWTLLVLSMLAYFFASIVRGILNRAVTGNLPSNSQGHGN